MSCFTSLSIWLLRVHPDPQRLVPTNGPEPTPRSVIFHRAARNEGQHGSLLWFLQKIECCKLVVVRRVSLHWSFQAGEDERRANALVYKANFWPQGGSRADRHSVNCSRKWRSKEGPAQAFHSWSLPLLLYKLNTASHDSLEVVACKTTLVSHILDFPLELPDILEFWDSALVISRLPPVLYDVCYSQAGRKAVSPCRAWSRGHRQWRRQTWPTTGGARGLLLEWVHSEAWQEHRLWMEL